MTPVGGEFIDKQQGGGGRTEEARGDIYFPVEGVRVIHTHAITNFVCMCEVREKVESRTGNKGFLVWSKEEGG